VNLSLGDLAVYPAHGVGKIEAVEERLVGNQKCDVVLMRILENGMKIMIPAQNVEDIGLRPLIDEIEVDRIFDIFRAPPKISKSSNWNRRQRDYMDRIKTGSPFDVASVMSELLAMRADKDLSFGERKLLDMVKVLLLKEMSLATGRSEKSIDEEICSFFRPAKSAALKS